LRENFSLFFSAISIALAEISTQNVFSKYSGKQKLRLRGIHHDQVPTSKR